MSMVATVTKAADSAVKVISRVPLVLLFKPMSPPVLPSAIIILKGIRK